MTKAPAQPNRSLIDGIAVLQALADAAAPVGSRELARRLGMETTRANRLLKTLAMTGLVAQDRKRRYHGGPGMPVLAAQVLHASLLPAALPHIDSLRHHGLDIAIGLRWRDRVTYLYHGTADMPVHQALGRIGSYPAARSSIGLCLLAQEEREVVEGLYAEQEPEGFGNLADLQKTLDTVQAQGFAKVVTGTVTSIGCPIGEQATAALALAGPNVGNSDHILRDIRTCAAAIDADMRRRGESRDDLTITP